MRICSKYMGFGGCISGIKVGLAWSLGTLKGLGTTQAAIENKEEECKKKQKLVPWSA